MDGGAIFRIDLTDRVLLSNPVFRKTSSQFTFSDYGQGWFDSFATTKHFIFPRSPYITARLVARFRSRFSKEGDADLDFIKSVTAELISWVEGIDVDHEISQLAAEKPEYGLDSENHITAVALLGNTDRIRSLREDVVSNREPRAIDSIVTVEEMDRALMVAEAVNSGEDILSYLSGLGNE